MKQRMASLLLASAFLLLLATPALAGGWVVVTLDQLPQHLRAGERTTLSFTVRQHGQRLINLENVVLTAHQPSSGATLTFPARQEGAQGHYVVDVLLPNAGEWQWEIQPDWFPTVALAPLMVLGTATASTTEPTAHLPRLGTGVGIVGLDGAAFLTAPVVHRLRIVADRLGLGLIVGRLGWAAPISMKRPFSLTKTVAAESATDSVAYGRALFMAKGCNTCHLHAEALNTWSTEAGPTLTDYQNTPEYLRVWLKDPQALKPNTEMPNLGLKATEIEALAAFLTQSTQ